MHIKCEYCGAENWDTSFRCSVCGALLPSTPGTRSVNERPTYLKQQRTQQARKKGSLYFNRRLLPFILPFLFAGTLFIIATFSPWVRTADGANISGWDLYHEGSAGMNGGNALYIPDVLNADKEDYARSGMLLTGVWTLTGGILLLFLAVVLVLVYQPRFLYLIAFLGLLLLVITGINLITMIFSRVTLEWPIYSLPATTVVVMIVAMDAHRVF
jgi:hypothetical protein